MIFQWQVQPVAHEFEVPLDGLGADFEFSGKLGGVGKFAGLDRLMNSQHPRQWWPGVRVPGILFSSRFHCPPTISKKQRPRRALNHWGVLIAHSAQVF